MSQNQIVSVLAELAELKSMQDELTAEIDALQDKIKAHMTETEQNSLKAGIWTVTYKPVTSTRIDSAALKKDFPDIYSEYGKTSTVKRFCIKAQ